ncbi:TetR family transcriptional regulator C-terminal domain-containing protein [Arthrobacter sp. LAPM80]|uniref:TetR/AcrR family transcriptional regulator n=1 Tax=Arthrobacter sp. LAPM80 TaxID=3141788 RepID=UPI00398B859A
MTRMNAQARRVEVLGETVRQIREKGMATVRIADVAAGMNVSPALIMYHFETKEKLMVEALTYAAERDLLKLARIMRGSFSPARLLMAALQWYAPTGQARGWKIWVDAWSASMRDASLAHVLADLQGQWTRAISGIIDDGVAAGTFTTESSYAAATRLTSLLDGLAVRMLVHKEAIDRAHTQAWLLRQVAWELGVQEDWLASEMSVEVAGE